MYEKKTKHDVYDLIAEIIFIVLMCAAAGGLVYALFHGLGAQAATINWEDYALGNLNGQYGWSVTGAGTAQITATGCDDGQCLSFSGATDGKQPRATTTAIYDCFAFNITSGSFAYSPLVNVAGDWSGSLRALASGTEYWIVLDDGSSHYTGQAIATSTWYDVCYINVVDGSTNPCWVTLDGVTIGADTCYHQDYFTFTSFSNNNNAIIDNIEQYDTSPSWTKLSWYWPNNGYELANDEWSDYSLWYDLDAADLGTYLLLKITSTHQDGTAYLAWDFIATTTALTNWTVERPNYLPDGEITSTAEILKTNLENCTNVNDSTCIWYSVVTSDTIVWTASSSGYTLDDNPYLSQPGFIAASTTTETDEGANLFKALWNRVSGIFPLSIVYQLNGALKSAELGSHQATLAVSLNDFLPDEYQVPGNPAVFQASLLDYNGFWTTTVYPTLNTIIYGLTLFAAIYILWPKESK